MKWKLRGGEEIFAYGSRVRSTIASLYICLGG